MSFHKSEVFALGTSSEEEQKMADILNCRVGQLHFQYLGVPISTKHLTVDDLREVNLKVQKRLPMWQGQILSSGGKSILIQSSLSSVPNYCMGMYKLQDDIHKKFDTDRANFFWHGQGDKRKYHMVKWGELARLKEMGGLGFTETRTMNVCLLSKWIFRIESDEDSLVMEMIRNKYLKGKGFFFSRASGGSQFWRGLHAIKKDFLQGACYKVGNGRKISLWNMPWNGETTLSVRFPNLFRICRNPMQSVAEAVENNVL